jgi:hypothetical protein
MCVLSSICFKLSMHWVRLALCFALLNAGSNMAARMAMMAITTSNSIKVNPRIERPCFSAKGLCFINFLPLIANDSSQRYLAVAACDGNQ